MAGRWNRLACYCIACAGTFAWLPAQERVLAQEPEPKSLPLPQHPERTAEQPEHSLPKASQPNREERHTEYVMRRTASARPVPGRPGRGLEPLSSEPEAAEAGSEEEAPRTLLNFLPHEFLDSGITIECIYTGETFTKAHGGLSNVRATNYRSNLDLVATANTSKLGLWDGGRFFVYGQNLAGKPISASDVGDIQLFSNLDSTISETERPHFTTVAEYWYEHVAMDDMIRMKIGKQDANVDFALTDLGGEFVNSSFGLPPMIPLPTFPSQALGLATFLTLTETATFGIAVYDGTLPSGPQGVRWGFDTLGKNGAISLYQLELKPQLGLGGEFPSTIRFGGWHHSDSSVWVEWDDVPDPRTFNQNYGFFTSADQMIWKESIGTDDDQGLGIFGQFGWAPSNRNTLGEYYGGGFVYKGLVPNRDADILGVGIANAMFSKNYRAASQLQGTTVGPSETAVEMFYKIIAGDAVSFQPDIQYIANPSGQYKDALVPGLRFELIF